LQDLFIESGVVSEGSIKGVLSGKHYNRSVFCHKIVYEAMQRLRFEAFLENLTDGEKEDRIMELVSDMSDAFPDKTFHSLVECPVFEEIANEYERFIIDASSKSRTFAFWTMYIKMTGEFNQYNYSVFIFTIVIVYSRRANDCATRAE
jgi:hypothetical protein